MELLSGQVIGKVGIMADLRIDRLTLHLPGFAELDAQRLLHQIAAQLAAAPLPVTDDRRLDSLTVNVSMATPASVDHLAEQVVTAILQQLAQTIG